MIGVWQYPYEITESQRVVELSTYARDVVALAAAEHLRFFPLSVTEGKGSLLRTGSGRSLFDFSASWTASAFEDTNPMIADAVARGAHTGAGASVLSAATDETTRLDERFVRFVAVREPDIKSRRVYLGPRETDSNTIAVAAVRHATGREGIVAFRGSYHGEHGTSFEISGIGVPERENTAQAELVAYSAAAAQLPEAAARLAQLLGIQTIAAVIVEATQCDGGVLVPPREFLPTARELCDRYGTLLILDEVKVGLGRTGKLFAYQHARITSDLVTLGKSLGGGLLVSASVRPADALNEPRASALLTIAGAPIAAATANAVLSLLNQPGLLDSVAALVNELRILFDNYPVNDRAGASLIADVRGEGLLAGVEPLHLPSAVPLLCRHSPCSVCGSLVAHFTLFVTMFLNLRCRSPKGVRNCVQGLAESLTRSMMSREMTYPSKKVAEYGGW